MSGSKRIVLADGDIAGLRMGKEVLGRHFYVLTAPTSEKLFQALEVFLPDLILLDVDLPEAGGLETLRRLKSGLATARLPVVMLSGKQHACAREEAKALGAEDFVEKPYIPAELIRCIDHQILLAEQHKDVFRYEKAAALYGEDKLSSLLNGQGAVPDEVSVLSKENAALAPQIEQAATHLAYLVAMVEEMRRKGVYSHEMSLRDDDSFVASAQFHDIGKAALHDGLLQKPGRLTAQEFEMVKQHTVLGVKLLAAAGDGDGQKAFFNNAKLFAASHHERWDGSGYPLGLRERDIPLQGRLMAIIDVYDALVSRRPYKSPLTHQQALKIIRAGAGIQFDPTLVNVFISVSDRFAEIKKEADDKETDNKGTDDESL